MQPPEPTPSASSGVRARHPYNWDETAGNPPCTATVILHLTVARAIEGLCLSTADDSLRAERGAFIFEGLYRALSAAGSR